MEFAIINVEDIQCNMSAFDDLVLSEVQKNMILVLAKTKIKKLDDLLFDDMIKEKEQDLSMLLQSVQLPCHYLSAAHVLLAGLLVLGKL